ncbi:MAG: GNAT family N-acetyltransferase, partial [Gammaproteobacteria bacterium]|nr:GNAT family N-acetyltransferase [Gammaproteobacteria bacterium]
AMSGKTLTASRTLRPLNREDSEFLYQLQTQNGVRRFFRNPGIPARDEHDRWFKKIFPASDSVLWIIEENKLAAGMLRLDFTETGAEVSIIVSPEKSAAGLGRFALNKLRELYPGTDLVASVHKDNARSVNLFQACGFKSKNHHGDFLEMGL